MLPNLWRFFTMDFLVTFKYFYVNLHSMHFVHGRLRLECWQWQEWYYIKVTVTFNLVCVTENMWKQISDGKIKGSLDLSRMLETFIWKIGDFFCILRISLRCIVSRDTLYLSFLSLSILHNASQKCEGCQEVFTRKTFFSTISTSAKIDYKFEKRM